MFECILTCSCSGVPEKANTSYKILFPDRELPENIAKDKSSILAISDKFPNTNLSRYAKGIAKQSGQFAYYLKADENGDIVENYNLLNGRRLG